jgi:uncharacterized protein (TIGR00251 family)
MYIKEHKEGVTIKVKVTPGSRSNALVGEKGDCLALKLTAPPTEGRANKELVRFLAQKLGIAPSSIRILRGHLSREKILLVSGVTRQAVLELLSKAEK